MGFVCLCTFKSTCSSIFIIYLQHCGFYSSCVIFFATSKRKQIKILKCIKTENVAFVKTFVTIIKNMTPVVY